MDYAILFADVEFDVDAEEVITLIWGYGAGCREDAHDVQEQRRLG